MSRSGFKRIFRRNQERRFARLQLEMRRARALWWTQQEAVFTVAGLGVAGLVALVCLLAVVMR